MSEVCRPRLLLNFIGLLTISSAAFSSNLDQDSWQKREKILKLKYTISPGTPKKRRRVELNIRRIKKEGGQPVIISHAVVLSNIAMRELGHLLWEKGYDVWMPNARGHGSADELTKVEPYLQGDYGFDKIVTEDWPQLLKHVYAETGKKVSIIGYSMGGMSWEQMLSGVYKEEGDDGIYQSDELARTYTKWVNGFAAIVVPPDFEKTSGTVKQLLEFMIPFIDKPFFIPFTLNSCNFLCFGIKSLVRDTFFGFAASRTYNWLPKGIMETSKLDHPRQDYREFVLTRVSSPHTDYIQDFLRWFQTDYESRDSHVNYAWNKKVFVPTLQIIATEDSLAPAEQILEKIKLYPPEAKMQVLQLEGFGHIDVSFQQGIKAMGESVLNFLENVQEKAPVLL